MSTASRRAGLQKYGAVPTNPIQPVNPSVFKSTSKSSQVKESEVRPQVEEAAAFQVQKSSLIRRRLSRAVRVTCSPSISKPAIVGWDLPAYVIIVIIPLSTFSRPIVGRFVTIFQSVHRVSCVPFISYQLRRCPPSIASWAPRRRRGCTCNITNRSSEVLCFQVSRIC